jgi:hypothetical protein
MCQRYKKQKNTLSMEKELTTYRIHIDLNDNETGVESNSLVHDPAHEIGFMTFNKKKYIKIDRTSLTGFVNDSFKHTQQFNDEEQVVTGIAISADQPIYRDSGEEEFNVVFTKADIKDIVHDYARKGRFNNLNLEHNPNDLVSGVSLVMFYQIDNDKGFTAPERFEDANDGSLIMSYKFSNKEVYDRVKDGEFTGFSIEGTFLLDDMEFSKDTEILSALDNLIELLK